MTMPWTADGRWVPENDSVAANLTGLLGSDSSYIKTARAAGQRTAQKRGLLNSSIAAGAGESAAIAAAAPIASQDASQTFQRNQAVLEGGITSGLNQQQNQQQLTVQQRDAEYTRQRDLLQQEGATAQQLREFDQRTKEQQQSIGSQERQALLGAETNLTQSRIAANTALAGQYLDSFANLANNPDIPADVRNTYMAEFQRVMAQGQSLINVVRSTPLTWGPGAIA